MSGGNKLIKREFGEILAMIKNACDNHFRSGLGGLNETIVECATQIYIAQMKESDTDEG